MVGKRILRVQGLALALLLLGLTGAAATAQDATVPAGNADLSGEITLWHGWTGTEADTLNNDLLPAWEAAYPNVDVEILAVPFGELQNKYSTEASTGGGPELVIGPADWIGGFADAELIKPLDDFVDESLLANYVPATLDGLRYNDQLYGLPESFETVALYYNKDLVPTPPGTTDELAQVAADIAAANPDVYGFALLANFYHPVGYLLGYGAQLFTEDNMSALDSPETVAFLTWLKDLNASPGVFMQNDDAAIGSLFKEGRAAMVINGPWALGDYQAALGSDKVGVAPLPLISGNSNAAPTPFLGVKHIMVNANADDEQTALAVEFAKWFTSPAASAILAEKAGHLPAHTGVDVSQNEIAQAFITQAQSAVPQPTIPEMGQVWDPAGAMITKVLNDEATPEEAAREAQEEINDAIESSGA